MKQLLLIFFLVLIITDSKTEIFIFKDCKNDNYNYEKNEYILDLDKGIMTREFIYDDESYQKLRLNDINVKKKNITNKGIAKEGDLIVSEISGYPAFFTQMIFNISIFIQKVSCLFLQCSHWRWSQRKLHF